MWLSWLGIYPTIHTLQRVNIKYYYTNMITSFHASFQAHFYIACLKYKVTVSYFYYLVLSIMKNTPLVCCPLHGQVLKHVKHKA